MQIVQSDKILRRHLKQLHDFGEQSRSDDSIQKYSENHCGVNWEEMEPINYNSASKLNEKVLLKYEIKAEPTDDNSSNLTEYADDTVETVSKSDSGEIVCQDSKVDASYCLKLGENICVIGKEENFQSSNQDIPLKFEIKDEPTDNSLNLTKCADHTVETVSKNDCGEIVCEDSKVDASYHLKLDENKCVIEKNENFQSSNPDIPLKFEIKDEPTYNSLNLTECGNDVIETLPKSDGSGICRENSKTDSGFISENSAAECRGKGEEEKKKISVIYEKQKATEKIFHCEMCDKKFTKSHNLKVHMLTHRDTKPYQCDVCKKCFNHLGNLNHHKRIHTGEKPYQCDVCKKRFSHICRLNTHKRIHTGEKPYQCDVCKKCFSHICRLNTHKRTHTGEKPYQCDVCKKCFSHICRLNTHKRIHTGEKPYQCDVCKTCFRSLNHLKIHKRTHTGEKPYQCDICKKCFSQISYFNIHKGLHTGEKPFQCDVCDKCFSQKKSLNNHKRTHTDEKPYQCDRCNKCFSQKITLIYHKRTHTGEKPYKCDVCKKCFNNSTALNVHKRTHTGERPYQCDVCNKCFRHSNGLSNHKRTHTGDKPYQCDICNKCFSVSWCLNVHKRTHTG